MIDIMTYLTIAGAAQRRLLAVNSVILTTPTAFPNGPDSTNLTQEAATCEAIIASSRGMLSAQMLQLSFTVAGRAVAQAPASLADSEYDQGTYHELED
jgi:hypothetical protein